MGLFNFKDNSREINNDLDREIEKALKEIGMQAVGHAVDIATSLDAVDTGRLRNSITYSTNTNHEAHSYKWNNSSKGTGAKGGSGVTKPMGIPEEYSVYIGTNVDYAAYIELGTSQNPTPRPFLKSAIQNYTEDYKKVFKNSLRNIGK